MIFLEGELHLIPAGFKWILRENNIFPINIRWRKSVTKLQNSSLKPANDSLYKHVHSNNYEPPRDNKMACAPSEDSDQPAHPPSLTRVFAVHMKKKTWVLSYLLSAKRRL